MNDFPHLPTEDDPKSWIDWTTLQQSRASDPAGSAWVSANAGSGKTHVLTQRVIRLLLAGARPSSILCLTYTKAAASEMSNRVFQRLAEWATLSDEELEQKIAGIEGSPPDRLKLATARQLFAKALETPGGLKIQTIHAFCEALLHQFPLEANVAGHFSVLDDRAAATLLSDARRSLLTATTSEDDPELAEAFAYVLELGDETGLEALLGDILANRNAVRDFIEKAMRNDGVDAALRRAFGLTADDTEDSIADNYWPLPGLSGPTLALFLDLASKKGGSRVEEVSYALNQAARETDRFKKTEFLEAALLTAKGLAKSDSFVINKAMKDAAPQLVGALTEARDHIVSCRNRLRIMRMFQATRAALKLAERLDKDYEDLKRQRSQLDFDDLIARTANLLTRNEVGPWVHYKLDQGIDHILVDEAQDTSPIQWTVIRSLAEDFHSGKSAREARRTIFAVGDEKQSIYSFQGARPERFSLERKETEERVRAGEQPFHAVRLPLSFRSTAEVLSAVDQVFSLPDNARGLSAMDDAVEHRSNRIGHPGAADVWEVVAPEISETEDDWTAPFDATPESAPPAILARRMAHVIGEMIGRETIIDKGEERLIEAGDVLVLVRKRDAFVNALTRALKKRGDIPVAGADRLKLTQHIAIQDLLALGRFLLLPEDDLSLAALLKSPLFDFSEEDIFDISASRAEATSVWSQLKQVADERGEKFAAAVQRLEHFMMLARQLPVHDFFARVLGSYGGRRNFLARLGGEAGDILDEFLTFTLEHEKAGLPGLQSFVSTLEMESPEVKREQDKGRNEVRIMTVHAAKGLEAPVVFLVDGSSKAFNHTHLARFRLLETESGPTPIWVPGKALGNSLTTADEDRLRQSTEEEYRRLLYVGMTRAADRLIVCGYRGQRDNPESWHAMVSNALRLDEDHCQNVQFSGPEGEWSGLSWRVPGVVPPSLSGKTKPVSDDAERHDKLPDGLLLPLPPQKKLPRPLSPSGAGTIIDDEADDLIVTSPLFGEKAKSGFSLQRGRLVHRMLQSLPDFPVSERESAVWRYAERAAPFWPESERSALVSAVMAVLSRPDLSPAFSENSRAEVSIMGTLTLDDREYAVSGRIDRLAVHNGRVLLLDYKTNRIPPRSLEGVPFAHKAQLAIYREVLAPLYPDSEFECILVYTESADVITLPPATLSEALAGIKTK